MSDSIDRQAAIDVLRKREKELRNINWYNNPYAEGECEGISYAMDVIRNTPSSQPDGIPLEWIDKHLEWLDNCDNDFAQLAKVGIRAMVEIWKKDKT